MPLVDQKEEWWVMVMGMGLDPELTKWSMHSDLAIVLTGTGYKEHHWLVIPHQPLWLFPINNSYSMPSSFRTILSSANHLGIGRAVTHRDSICIYCI